MIILQHTVSFFFFFFNDTATTEIYTLSLHDALPIWTTSTSRWRCWPRNSAGTSFRLSKSTPNLISSPGTRSKWGCGPPRSEEHTSELQSRLHLVCRLLLEKKKNKVLKHMANAETQLF